MIKIKAWGRRSNTSVAASGAPILSAFELRKIKYIKIIYIFKKIKKINFK
jgi:hypothetical protein